MGPELVRGFQSAGIGPRDFAIANAAAAGGLSRLPDAVGGTMYWGASAEVTFPITFLPKDFGMRGAVYADAGSVWGYNSIRSFNTGGGVLPVTLDGSDQHKVRSSVGVGLLWNSPFGPIRFDYSFVLSKARGDQTQAFRFFGRHALLTASVPALGALRSPERDHHGGTSVPDTGRGDDRRLGRGFSEGRMGRRGRRARDPRGRWPCPMPGRRA